MPTPPVLPAPERWARFRFSIVGPLLAGPPVRGELRAELEKLAARSWLHPLSGEPARFGASTIERWYYVARGERVDRIGVLRRKVRKDRDRWTALSSKLRDVLFTQYRDHKSWSYLLHLDNLRARIKADATLGPVPSYSSVRRFMRAHDLRPQPRRRRPATEGAERAAVRLESREVRDYEATHVHALWHFDFHHGSRPVLTPGGEWITPILLGILDDRSRLACHAQWYFSEDTEALVHGLCQGFQKRGLPTALLSDNGSAMQAAEVEHGVARLSMTHQFTLPYSPYQNGKQEAWWGPVEGRLVAMLEGVPDLTLRLLNEATQAWVELEYNRKFHSEIGMSPIERALAGPSLVRECPGSEALRLAFMTQEIRTQRRSDGTICLAGRRFELPNRYRTLSQVTVRYARWDLSVVYLADPTTDHVLCRIYPVDKAANADGRRRVLEAVGSAAGAAPDRAPCMPAPAGIAPLLAQLMADYAASGLPPAYLPHPASTAGAPQATASPKPQEENRS